MQPTTTTTTTRVDLLPTISAYPTTTCKRNTFLSNKKVVEEMKSEVREVGEFFNNITTQLHMPRQNTKLCRNGGSSGKTNVTKFPSQYRKAPISKAVGKSFAKRTNVDRGTSSLKVEVRTPRSDARKRTKPEIKNNVKQDDEDKQLQRFHEKCLDFSFLEDKPPLKDHHHDGQTRSDSFQPLFKSNQKMENGNDNVPETQMLRDGFNTDVCIFDTPSVSQTGYENANLQGIFIYFFKV